MAEPEKTKAYCRLTALEAATLSFALAAVNDLVVSPEQLTEEVTVLDRRNSKVGSFVDFNRSRILKTNTPHTRKIYDHIGGSFCNRSIDFGVLVFVDNGYISGLEFFIYGHASLGDDWLEEQSEFDLFINKDELT